MSRGKTIKNLIQFISLVIILGSLFFLVIPALNRFRNEIDTSKDRIISKIEDALGLSIQYKKMSPIVTTIIIDGVKIKTTKGDTYLNVDRLELDLNLLKMLTKKGLNLDFFHLMSSLTLIDADSVFDVNDLDFLINFYGDINNGSVIPYPIKGKGINLTIRNQGFNMVLNNAKVKLNGALSKYNYTIDTRIQFFDTLLEDFGTYESDIIFKGTANNDFSYVDADIDFDNIYTHIGVIDRQKVKFFYKNKFIEVLRDDELLRLLFRFKPDFGDLFFNLDTKGLSLNKLIEFNDKIQGADNLKDIQFKGNFKGLYNLIDYSFIYSSKGNIKLDDKIVPVPINLSFNLLGDTNEASFYYLNAFTKRGSANFSGSFNFETLFPRGKLDINNFEIADNLNLNTSVQFNVINKNYIGVNFKDIEIQDIILGDFPTLAYIDDKDINLKLLKEDDGLFSLSCNYDRINNYLSTNFVIEDYTLGKFKSIGTMRDVYNYANPRFLDLKGSFETDFSNYAYDIKDLQINSGKENILESDIRGNNNKVFVDYLKADVKDFNFLGKVEGLIGDNDLKINLDCLLNDNKYNIDALVKDGEIQLRGNHGLNLKLFFNDSIYVDLKTDRFPFTYQDYTINPSIDLKAVLFNNNDFLVSVKEFNTQIKHPGFKFNPYLSFIMDGNQERVQFNSIRYNDSIADLNGTLKVVRDSKNLLSFISKINGPNNEQYQLDGSYGLSSGYASIDLEIENSKLERFYIDNLSGVSSLSIKGSGTLDNFTLKGELNTDKIDYDNNLVDLDFGFNLNESFISLNNLESRFNDSKVKIPLITYNYKDGSVLGNIKAEQKVDVNSFVLENVLDLKIKPVEKISEISLESFSKINGSLNIKSLYSNDEELFSNKVIRIFNNKTALQLISVDKKLKATYFYGSGLIYSNVEKPYFIALKAKGNIKDGEIDLLLNDIDIDATIAQYFMPYTPEGDKRIVDFDMLNVKGQLNFNGDISNPNMNGLLWTEAKLDVEYVNDEIDLFRLNLRIKDNEITILPGYINIGDKGEIKVNGEIKFDSWIPNSFKIYTSIEQEKSIPLTYQYDIINVDTNIYTDEFVIVWEDFVTRILGGVTIVDSEITTKAKKEVIQQEETQSGSGGLLVDIGVKIGKNNTLFFPNKQFPIVEATANAGSEIKIIYNSGNETFSVDGDITIREGSVAYSGKPFILREGDIKLQLSEENIDPRVYIVGSKTVIYNDQKYDILLTYQGGLISGLVATRSSNPPLSDDEILSLLGIAVVENRDELFEVTDLLGAAYVTEPVETAIKDVLGIDYVNIESKILSNFFNSLMPDSDQGGTLQDDDGNITNSSFDPESNSEYNDLSKFLSDTSISFGDFITDDLFIKGTVGTVYDTYEKELGMDLDFELNLTTPHFELGFGLKPKLEEDTYFSPELKLSLQWRWVPGEEKEN